MAESARLLREGDDSLRKPERLVEPGQELGLRSSPAQQLDRKGLRRQRLREESEREEGVSRAAGQSQGCVLALQSHRAREVWVYCPSGQIRPFHLLLLFFCVSYLNHSYMFS